VGLIAVLQAQGRGISEIDRRSVSRRRHVPARRAR
jgi:hypothetical protein